MHACNACIDSQSPTSVPSTGPSLSAAKAVLSNQQPPQRQSCFFFVSMKKKLYIMTMMMKMILICICNVKKKTKWYIYIIFWQENFVFDSTRLDLRVDGRMMKKRSKSFQCPIYLIPVPVRQYLYQ
jgi:hypothetical protein